MRLYSSCVCVKDSFALNFIVLNTIDVSRHFGRYFGVILKVVDTGVVALVISSPLLSVVVHLIFIVVRRGRDSLLVL